MSTETVFSKWLREEMPRRGYPVGGPRAGGISRLAVDAGISQANMSRIANGQQQPSLDALRKIGKVFGYEIIRMMTFAGLADDAAAESATIDRPRFTVHNGGGEDHGAHQSQPPVLTEQEFDRMLARGEEPPTPPGGFLNSDEKTIWAMGQPADWRWAGIKAIRERQRQYRPHEKDPGRHA